MDIIMENITSKELDVLMKSLEVYSKVGVGKIEKINIINGIYKRTEDREKDIEEKIKELKMLIFKEITLSQYYGIHNKMVSEDVKIAHDLLMHFKSIKTEKPLSKKMFVYPQSKLTIKKVLGDYKRIDHKMPLMF